MQYPVRRRPVHILHGCHPEPRVDSSQSLELAVVRRHHHLGRLAQQLLQDGLSQCSSLRRVCSRGDLVEEDKGPLVGVLEHGVERLEVGGEGGEILLDCLLVSDGRQHPPEQSHLRPLLTRHPAAMLHQKRTQPNGLEYDGLPSGVGPRDHDRRLLPVHAHVVGNRLDTPQHQHRVPPGPDVDLAPARHLRPDRLEHLRKLFPRRRHVQLAHS
mmetsp:Transcript_26077/g.85770  ORF Transcript_26077/g.85770 Transcript_26077/m.85770 type:complete len:213 (+) Transcript_26077:943-1581(+)